MNSLPLPLTPPDCDLRDFKFMPLDVVRLRDSDIATVAEGDEFRCAVLLWCASWHQVPAASLPDDDKVLAQYAGFGRVVKEWMRVRNGALRGWIKCSDGRLYHPVVAEKANESWLAKLRQRLKTECGRIKKHNERHGTKIPFPDFDDWFAAGCPVGQALPVPGDNGTKSPGQSPFVPSDNHALSPGQDGDVTGENPSKGQGEGQGEGQGFKNLKARTAHENSTGVGAGNSAGAGATAAEISKAMRTKGVQSNPSDPRLLAIAEQGVSIQTVIDACDTAKEAKPDESIPLGYVIGILQRWAKEAAAIDVKGAQAPAEKGPKPPVDSWWASDAGIDRKGKELGMHPKSTESYAAYKDRIFAELRKREGGKAA